MKYCTECGNLIKNTNNQYCTHCGALLVVKDNTSERTPVIEKTETFNTTTSRRKRRKPANRRYRKGLSKGKKSGIVGAILFGFSVLYIILHSIGIDFDTMSQIVGKVSTEEVIEDAYNDRHSFVTISMRDLNKTYGDIETSYYSIHDLLLLTPEYYLLDRDNITYAKTDHNNTLEINLRYFNELQSDASKLMIDLQTSDILRQVPEGASQWETAKIIHDELIKRVTYEENAYEGTMYGALVNHKAVCAGFAVAYEYLLERAGIPCETMAGYVVDEERTDFGSVTDSFLSDTYGHHAWNIVTLTDPDGTEKSYIVDVTWDNTDSYNDNGEEYISYSWFMLSLPEFRETGRLPYPNYNYDNWDMSSRALNYYTVMDAVITDYDIDKIADALQRQLDNGNNMLSVCWDDTARYLEAKEKIENGDISKILRKMDNRSYAYSMTEDRYTSGKYCLNVYVKD